MTEQERILYQTVNLLRLIESPTEDDTIFAELIARTWKRTVSTTFTPKPSQDAE